jgi:DNA repair exonuclease SbcCD ATPase subunit
MPAMPDKIAIYPMYSKVNENEQQEWLDSRLSQISDFIAGELRLKQETISRLEAQLHASNVLIVNKDDQLEELREKLVEYRLNTEGLRQLINKLLNDIEKYQRDIEWYRRTYEQRSLLGIFKDKFFRKQNSIGK